MTQPNGEDGAMGLQELIQRSTEALASMSPVDQALHLADQKRSFIRGQLNSDPGEDVLAAEVRRLRGLLASTPQETPSAVPDEEGPIDRKWFGVECAFSGCQSLVLRARAERAEELAEKYKWQVTDTCARAEKAEAALSAARPQQRSILSEEDKDSVLLSTGLSTPKILSLKLEFPFEIEHWLMGTSKVTEGNKLQRYEEMFLERARVMDVIKTSLTSVFHDAFSVMREIDIVLNRRDVEEGVKRVTRRRERKQNALTESTKALAQSPAPTVGDDLVADLKRRAQACLDLAAQESRSSDFWVQLYAKASAYGRAAELAAEAAARSQAPTTSADKSVVTSGPMDEGDLFYHAADNTWWKADNGRLKRVESSADHAERRDHLVAISEGEGHRVALSAGQADAILSYLDARSTVTAPPRDAP